MHRVPYLAVAALSALAMLPRGWRQPDPDLVLRAVRSYRAEHQQTEVDAFVQVPYMLLETTGEGEAGGISYRVAVRVSDSTGLTLLQQSWQNHAPASVRAPEAFALDIVRFSLAPGRYRLDVSVEDSVSGRRAAAGIELEGFPSTPPASDLLLSPEIRPVTAEDTIPRPAEFRWGRMLVTAAARLQLTPLRPNAFYLLEAYPDRQQSGTIGLAVVDSTGKVVTRTTPMPVEVPAGGGVIKGQLDLTGLPPGRYTMTASLALGSQAVERSAAFTMAALEQTLARDVVRREAARNTDQGYFEAMRDDELDAARQPLSLIAKSGELESYSKDLSVRAKRRFLTEFWRRRDPTPDTPDNETRVAFYQAIEYANRTYREAGRKTVPGWKTDRGRIYVRNGVPNELLQRRQEGRAPPYEVWRYRKGKDRYYIFADRSQGIGTYQLIHSNDINETGMANWREIIREEAVADIGRFLGIDFFAGNQG